MGLGYEVVRGLKPDVIMIALSGYGAHRAGARVRLVRPGAGAALGHVVGHRLQGLAADARRHLVRRSDRRPARRRRGARRALPSRRAPARASTSTSRSGRRPMAVLPEALLEYDDERRAAAARRQSRSRTWRRTACSVRGRGRWVSIAVGSDDGMALASPRSSATPSWPTIRASPPSPPASATRTSSRQRLTRWTSTRSPEEATHRLQAAGVAAFPTMTNQDWPRIRT